MNSFTGISQEVGAGRDGADSFIDQLFFKNAYFPEHLSAAVTTKSLKAMSNLTELGTGNYLHTFSSVFRTLLNIYGGAFCEIVNSFQSLFLQNSSIIDVLLDSKTPDVLPLPLTATTRATSFPQREDIRLVPKFSKSKSKNIITNFQF